MRTHHLLLSLLLVTAFTLRAWAPSRMAVEHFDEGVYTSNFYSGHLDFKYPDRHLYAPPMLPAIYEWILILTQSPHSVMWFNVILGTGLVGAIWWLVRLIVGVNILGETAALAVAVLMTFDNFMIQYSRAALTDIPVCLLMVLAVGMGLKGMRNHIAWTIPAAIFTALAWWTKYNGWLPLAITGAGIGGWIVFERVSKKQAIPVIVRFGLLLLLAVLLWSPCLFGLQQFGGYSAVAKNHAGYVVGWSGWWDGVARHFLIQQHYSMSSFLAGAGAVVVLQMLFWPITLTGRGGWWLAPALIVTTFYYGDLTVLAMLASIGLYNFKQELNNSKEVYATLGWWMLLAWILGLLLTTPLYRPYPRLLCPLKIALIMAGGMGIVATLKTCIGADPSQDIQKLFPIRKKVHTTILVGMLLGLQILMLIKNPSYQSRIAFEVMAKEIVSQIKSSEAVKAGSSVKLDAIIYIIAEPGLYYHLASLEDGRFDFITQPGSNLGMLAAGKIDPRVPTFLILGPHAKEERVQLEAFKQRLTHINNYNYIASDLVLLDDFPPSAIDHNRHLVVQLFHVK